MKDRRILRPSAAEGTIAAAAAAIVLFTGAGSLRAQELEPRTYAPSPVGTTFVLGGFGKSTGGILFDQSLDIDNVQAELWISTFGFGRTFDLFGRQARMLAVFPLAWGDIEGDVHEQFERQELGGLVDPRFKLMFGLVGAPALTRAEFGRLERGVTVGASITIIPPWGQYDSRALVNLGYNRWAFKPEIGVSRPVGRWTIEGYASAWLFTTNDAFYPGRLVRRQDPVVALQAHASHPLPHRMWIALDATFFAGGDTRVDGTLNPDHQRNSRLGATFSVPIVGQQSLKFVYSTGATTRRGNDFDTVNVTWQLVMF
jgi:hypothetical protein